MSTAQNSDSTPGRLLSLLIIPVGILAWVLLWKAGFIASIAAFGIAYGALWLFQLGAKTQPTRSDAYFLVGVILVGVILSFLGGMVSDAWTAWSEEFSESTSFFSGDFWSFVIDNFSSSELWGAYTTDILLSLLFVALGTGGMIKDLLSPASDETSAPATQE